MLLVPALTLMIAAALAGHPVGVVCDVPEGGATAVEAWTYTGGNTIHMRPSLCEGLSASPGTPSFAWSLGVLIHESAHTHGVVREDCAELWADLLVYQVLDRFYGIPFFSPLSWDIGNQVYRLTLRRPPAYRPHLYSCSI